MVSKQILNNPCEYLFPYLTVLNFNSNLELVFSIYVDKSNQAHEGVCKVADVMHLITIFGCMEEQIF